MDLKRCHQGIEKSLPMLLNKKSILITKRDKEGLSHLSEYLENITESLEIVLNEELALKMNELPQIMDKISNKLPNWHKSMEFLQ